MLKIIVLRRLAIKTVVLITLLSIPSIVLSVEDLPYATAENEFLLKHKLTSTGYGPIILGMTLKEGLDAAGLSFRGENYDKYNKYQCGSYILARPKRGDYSAYSSNGKLRLLMTYGIIRRIDVWDPGIETIFSIRLNDDFSPLSEEFTHGAKIQPNHYGGMNHYYLLRDSANYLTLTVNQDKVSSLILGKYPEVAYTEGCA